MPFVKWHYRTPILPSQIYLDTGVAESNDPVLVLGQGFLHHRLAGPGAGLIDNIFNAQSDLHFY